VRDLEPIVAKLRDVNARIWRHEKEARKYELAFHCAQAKQYIDELNQKRAELIQDLAGAIDLAIPEAPPGTTSIPVTEHPAQAIDRLTIEDLRAEEIEKRPDAADFLARFERCREAREWLRLSIEQALLFARKHKILLPKVRQNKLYNSEGWK
jgi:hypothetical protein